MADFASHQNVIINYFRLLLSQLMTNCQNICRSWKADVWFFNGYKYNAGTPWKSLFFFSVFCFVFFPLPPLNIRTAWNLTAVLQQKHLFLPNLKMRNLPFLNLVNLPFLETLVLQATNVNDAFKDVLNSTLRAYLLLIGSRSPIVVRNCQDTNVCTFVLRGAKMLSKVQYIFSICYTVPSFFCH